MKKQFKPTISIIMNCHNGERYLHNSLTSIINQSYPKIEFIIIDGGSTDNTIEVIKKYESHIDFHCKIRFEVGSLNS